MSNDLLHLRELGMNTNDLLHSCSGTTTSLGSTREDKTMDGALRQPFSATHHRPLHYAQVSSTQPNGHGWKLLGLSTAASEVGTHEVQGDGCAGEYVSFLDEQCSIQCGTYVGYKTEAVFRSQVCSIYCIGYVQPYHLVFCLNCWRGTYITCSTWMDFPISRLLKIYFVWTLTLKWHSLRRSWMISIGNTFSVYFWIIEVLNSLTSENTIFDYWS